ncbi:MAG: caspase family protein [Pseudomonadota bacterium]
MPQSAFSFPNRPAAVCLISVILFLFILLSTTCPAAEPPELFLQLGHSSSINAIAISADGKFVISGSDDRTLKLWDIDSGREIRTFKGHPDNVVSVAVSPDGRYAASACRFFGGNTGKNLILWELTSGRELRSFTGHSQPVKSVVFTPDGRHLITGSDGSWDVKNKTLTLWEIATGRIIRAFGDYRGVNALAITPDGRFVVSNSGGDGHVLSLWEVATGRQIRVFAGHSRSIGTIAISADGKRIVSASDDKSVKVWDVASGREITTLKGHGERVLAAAISPDGRYVLSGSVDDTLRLWDADTGREVRRFEGHRNWVTAVAMSPDGRHAVSGSHRTLKLWDITDGRQIRAFEGNTDSVSSVAVSGDGRFAVAGVRRWDIVNGREIGSLEGFSGSSRSVAVSPDGRYVLLQDGDLTLKLWDAASGRAEKTLYGESGTVNAVAFTPDGRFAITGGGDSTLKLWDISRALRGILAGQIGKGSSAEKAGLLTGDLIVAIDGAPVFFWDDFVGIVQKNAGKRLTFTIRRNEQALDIAIVPAAAKLEDDDGKTRTVGRVGIGQGGDSILRRFTGHTKPVNAIAVSPDGRYAASGSNDKTIKLWDIGTGTAIRTLQGHTGAVTSVAISPDGRFVISAGMDSMDDPIRFWDMATGEQIRAFGRKTITPLSWLDAIAFSRDGRVAITGGSDDVLRVWDVASGEEIRVLSGHTGWVKAVAVTADGKSVVSASHDGSTRLWNLATGKEIAQFAGFSDGEWIVVTPAGYFNASPNGARHLNVRVGNQALAIDNFYETFFNPVRVALALQGRESAAVADIRKGFMTPPAVTITAPVPDAPVSTDTISVTVSAKDTGGGIDEIRLYHNEKAIGEDRRAITLVPRGDVVTKTYTVTLVEGANYFRAIGFSKDRTESNPAELALTLSAPPADVSLYVLVVGINRYRNPALNLNYAEPDARGISGFFAHSGQRIFKKVAVIEVYNEQATKENVIATFKQLQNTQLQDAVLIYLAGHGESLDDKWYFIPHDLTYPERPEDIQAKGISSDTISEHIKTIPAQKILVLIDACKSGAVLVALRGFEDRKSLSQLSRATGVHVIAASAKDQYAAEVQALGHGVFTYTLLEGLRGKAAGGTGVVTVRKLMGYVEEHLPDLTKKYKQEAQYPVVDSRGMDFPLALTK